MSRKTALFALLVCLGAAWQVAPAGADDATLVAYMTGAAERPGPGDPDAVGRAVITIDDAANQICVAVQVANVELPATGLHIHLAPPESPGPIVVPFGNPTTGQYYECRTVADEALLDNIAANPQQYYINIHNRTFPGGAARGQLQRA